MDRHIKTQHIDKNVIQKMANTIDILTNELVTLQQDKSNMKSTFDQQYLTLDFKTKMKNKEQVYEQKIF